eukprot:3764182-Lingulodinium_polyedra.AAC.1
MVRRRQLQQRRVVGSRGCMCRQWLRTFVVGQHSAAFVNLCAEDEAKLFELVWTIPGHRA